MGKRLKDWKHILESRALSHLDALLGCYESGQAGVAELHLMWAMHTFFPSADLFAITRGSPKQRQSSPDQQRGISAGPRDVHGKNREQLCTWEGGEKKGNAIPALHSYTHKWDEICALLFFFNLHTIEIV